MAERAHVTSVEALESFRSRLIVYLSQARPALEEVSADVVRARQWLETDQRMYWENQFRRRAKEHQEAQQALFSARLSNLRLESSMEQMLVHRTKRALDEAEQKLRILKKWRREFDGQVQPLVKQMEKLQTVFSHDMVQAVAFLTQAINTLAAYAEVKPPDAPAAAAPAATPTPPTAGPTSAPASEATSPTGEPA